MSLTVLISLFLAAFTHAATLPQNVMGFYVLIADDTVENYTSTDVWTPQLYDYQLQSANVFWLTFINPSLMPDVPPAMQALAMCRGSGQKGCPSNDQVVILSIGGYSYSAKPNPWPFLTSSDAAESMAQEIVDWKTKYGIDGIDFDIESGAGNSDTAGANAIVMFQKIKELDPTFIITQPTYGYPQIDAEIDIINAGCKNEQFVSNNLINTVGLMVYSNDQCLQYVPDYANATSEWEGFPITCNTPSQYILGGIQGSAGCSSITNLATECVSSKYDIMGIMVWFASVYDSTNMRGALSYGSDDASSYANNEACWQQALNILTI